MSIELVVDNREHELIQKLQSVHTILVEQLELGDIIFRSQGKTILIIERKTVNDLKWNIKWDFNNLSKFHLKTLIFGKMSSI